MAEDRSTTDSPQSVTATAVVVVLDCGGASAPGRAGGSAGERSAAEACEICPTSVTSLEEDVL